MSEVIHLKNKVTMPSTCYTVHSLAYHTKVSNRYFYRNYLERVDWYSWSRRTMGYAACPFLF